MNNNHLENLRVAVRDSIIRKSEGSSTDIIDLNVIKCATKFISSDFNKTEILFFIMSTLIEIEGLRLAMESSADLQNSLNKLITSLHEAEYAEDTFAKTATEGIYKLGNAVTVLQEKLDNKPAEMARSGGKGRKRRYEPLVQRTIELYNTKKWHSARQAARSIESELIEMGKEIGVPFTGDQPWETIQKWILKYSKK